AHSSPSRHPRSPSLPKRLASAGRVNIVVSRRSLIIVSDAEPVRRVRSEAEVGCEVTSTQRRGPNGCPGNAVACGLASIQGAIQHLRDRRRAGVVRRRVVIESLEAGVLELVEILPVGCGSLAEGCAGGRSHDRGRVSGVAWRLAEAAVSAASATESGKCPIGARAARLASPIGIASG
ncbi:uncharacterized protein CC84DRAFT_1235301, partial [Paraphaeosphaeria sporulosa]